VVLLPAGATGSKYLFHAKPVPVAAARSVSVIMAELHPDWHEKF
jgi:hypothetical protein